MLVKYQDLTTNLNKKIYPLYVILGQDQYLQNAINQKIKKIWCKETSSDAEIIDIDDDWQNAFTMANSYSLFSELLFLEIRFSKKTITNNFKQSITQYLGKHNPKSLVVVKAFNLNYKQLDFLVTNKNLQIFSAQPLNMHELEVWIKQELHNANLKFENNVPKFIAESSQNNMLAAHQTLIKLKLTNDTNKQITCDFLLEFMNNQAEYPVYDLTTACLQANFVHARNIFRKLATNNQNTSVYILWLLSHEIQNLIYLKQTIINSQSLQNAFKKLKIWPQKTKIYEKALQRFSLDELENLLKYCAFLDFQLKSAADFNTWNKLEQIIKLTCLGWSNNDKILVNEI